VRIAFAGRWGNPRPPTYPIDRHTLRGCERARLFLYSICAVAQTRRGNGGPANDSFGEFADAGGLMSYGPEPAWTSAGADVAAGPKSALNRSQPPSAVVCTRSRASRRTKSSPKSAFAGSKLAALTTCRRRAGSRRLSRARCGVPIPRWIDRDDFVGPSKNGPVTDARTYSPCDMRMPCALRQGMQKVGYHSPRNTRGRWAFHFPL